jgi:ABC-type lipoprotein export system ATPase subunit
MNDNESPLRSPRMGSQLSEILERLQKQQMKPALRSSDKEINVREIVVAVMGATGAGKSTLIRRLTSDDNVVVGAGLQSGKKHCGLISDQTGRH